MAVIKISKSDIIRTNAENHKIEVKRNELSYDSALVSSWESNAKKSFTELQNYNTKLTNHEYFSLDDLRSYKSALDSYIKNNDRLRELSNTFGQGYTDEQKKEWSDAITSLQGVYKEASNYFSQFKDENEYKDAVKLSELYNMSSAEIQPYLDKSEYESKRTELVNEQTRIKEQIRKLGASGNKGKGAFEKKKLNDELSKINAQIREIDATNGVAYTTTSGQNIVWQSLYDQKKFEEDLNARYKEYSNEKDWVEKSKYYQNNTQKTAADVSGIFDENMDWQYEHTANYFPMPNKEDKYYSLQMTDKEKEVFNYIYHTQGKDAAYKWHASIVDILKKRADEKYVETVTKFAKKAPVLSDATSILANTFAGAEYIGNYLAGNGIEKNKLATFAQTIRSTRAEQIDLEIGDWDAFDFLYNTSMSMADSAASQLAFGKAGGIALGLSAAAQGTNDALNRGMNNKQAFWNGLAAGVFEGVFESISIGNFKALKESLGSGIKNIAKNIGKSMLVNASEETLTEIANIMYDTIANGDYSQAETAIRQYMNMGFTESEAKKKVALELGGQVAEAAASGAWMGFGFGGIAAVPAHKNAKAIEQSYGKEDIADLINRGMTVPDSEAYKLAQQYRSKIKEGKSLSAQEIVDLEKAIINAVSEADVSKIKQAVETRLIELGERSNTTEIANAITKKLVGEDISVSEDALIEDSKYGNRVLNEAMPENIVSGEYASEWAKSIGTNWINKNIYNMNLQSTADGVVDSDTAVEAGVVQSNNTDSVAMQQGGQVGSSAAPGVVEGADGKQYFDDDSGDEYFGDPSGDDVAHGGDEYDNVAHLTTAEGGASPQGEAIDSENSNDLQLSEPALKDIARAPTAEESIAAAISNEQLDTKQRRILDFVEQHFPEITLKFSGNMTKDGLWDSDSKTLLLNTKQTVAGMYIEVLKHEFMHRLESKRLYQEFKQFLFNKDVTFSVWAKAQCKVHGIELTQNATASEAISKLTEYYHDSVKNDMAIAKKYREAFTMDGAQREMVADFFGEVMFNGKKYRTQTAQALADETFITIFDESERAEFQASSMAALAEIAEYKPNIFQQIVNWVKRIILKLRGTRIKADAILADELERNIKMLEDYVKQVYNSRDTKKAAKNGGGVEFAFGSNIMLNDADEEAYMSTGQSLHTRNKKTRMLEKGKNPVLKTAEEAKTFISQVIKGQAGGEVRTFGRVGQRLANAIKQKRSSLDLYGKYLEINADDLRESYKRHKNPKEKGDISLSDDDFCKIPEYLNSFDNVLSVNTYNGKIEIHISKETTDGYVKILTIVSKERESLQVTKIVGNSKSKFEKKYGTKKERDIGSPRGQTVKTEDSNPSTTARHTADALSNNSISNPDEIVNTEKSNDKNNDNGNQNPSFAVTSQMQQLRYNPEAYTKYILRQFGAKNIDNERIAKKIKQIVAQDNKSAKAQEDTRQKVYDRDGNLVGELTLKERLINELAVEISESIEAPLMAEADEVLSGLKERPLRVNEKQEAEIRHQFGTLANFRKDTGIRLVSEKSKVAAGLTTLEDAWNGDWVTDYAGWFKGDVSDVNMPIRLAEIVEQLNGMTEELDTEAIAAEVADSLTKTLNETGPKAEKRRANEAYRRGVADEHAKNKKQISELQKQNRNLKNRVKPKDVQNIRKEVERIYKKLAANSSTKHVHQGLKKAVSEFLELFNQSDEFTFKPADRDKVTRLWREYQKLAETDATSEAYGYDAQIAINIEMLEDILPGRSMWELHPDELAQVKEIIQNVSHCIEQTNNMIINSKTEEIATVANSVRVELGHKKGKIFDLGKLDLDMKNTTPVYFFERLGSKTLQKLFGGIKKGENVWAQNMLAARDKIAEIRKRYGYNKWKDVTLKFTTKLGDQIELDLEQAMLLYATVKRERANLDQEAEHTYIGGVVIPTKKVKSLMSDIRGFAKRDGESDANAKKRYEGLVESLRKQIDVAPHQIRVSDFAKVSDFLTKQQKAYVDEMVAYLSNDMAKLGNEVSMQLFGIEKFNEKYYIPYNSADNFIASMPGVEPTSSIKHRSFTKDLTHGANNPLMLTSFSEVCANHIEQMCMYNAMAIPVDNLTRVLNYTVPGTETSKATSIKDEIERVLGKSGLRYINNLIRDMSGSVRVSDLDSLVGRFTSRYKKAAVLASLSVVIQQPTSIVRAFKYIPAKYFLKTTFKVAERNYEQMKQYVGEAIIKEMGGFDTGVGATNSDYLLQPKRTVGQFIDDVAGWGANKADQITWGHIWAASKRMVAEQNPSLQVGSDAFFEKASEICSETLSKTQVYDSVLVKSEAMRSKSELSKMMTAFMGEPTVTYNMMMGALRDVTAHKKGAVKALAGTSAVIIGQIVVNAAFKSLVYAMRDDDEDETYFEKWLASFVESSVSDLNYFNYLPYVKDIVSIMQGYSVERMDVAAIADIKQAIEKAFAENATDLERLKNLCTAFSLLTGVPVKNIWRDAEGAYNTIHNAIKKDMVNTPEGSKKAARVGFAEALDWLPGIEIDTDGSARLVSELEDNVTYDSFDDANKKKVEDGVSDYLKSNEKFEKGELRSKSKTFESLYEMRRKYGSNSKKYRKERKKLIDSGIDEKDLELGLEIAKFKYLEQNGITVAEYYAAKTELNRKDGEDKVYDTDGSGGLNKKETKAAIKKMKGFDENEKDILFDILKP